jgi:hypothetical protein
MMQNIKFPKTAIAAIVVVMGIATVQTMSMLSIQSAAAQAFPQGQCFKLLEDFGFPREQAKELCKEFFVLNQGQCIQFLRELGFEEEFVKDFCKEIEFR